ncbi:hypothetical protein [Granulicella tundricola]|uniref:hypothetical protein n=1 Tax=Granulicella tundricola TaxID=940615 RepID=UPI000323C51E|nr:hypothetical protein [Granulicella tundricola]
MAYIEPAEFLKKFGHEPEPEYNSDCSALCQSYKNLFSEYERTSGKIQATLKKELLAIAQKMHQQGCPPCLLE